MYLFKSWLVAVFLVSNFSVYSEILTPKNTLGKVCLEYFNANYKEAKNTKVFIYARDSTTGRDRCIMHRGDKETSKLISEAKSSCSKFHTSSPCKVVSINNNWMAKEGDFPPISQPEKALNKLEIKKIMIEAKLMLKGNCLAFFEQYIRKENHKAFAYALDKNANVSCAEANRYISTKVLIDAVLKSCETFKRKLGKKAPLEPCVLFSLDNKIVAKKSDFAKALKIINNKKIDIFELAKIGVPNELQEALDLGLDINIQDKFGATPLLRAIEKNRFDNVKFLIEHGADIQIKENLGFDALNRAISSPYDNTELVTYLINKGSDINTRTNRPGDTPLHNAAYHGKVDLVKLLLEKGVDVNVQNNYTEAPMHKAADQNNVDVLKVLLENGADINLQTRRGITPLDEALFRKRKEATQFLKENGAKEHNPQHE